MESKWGSQKCWQDLVGICRTAVNGFCSSLPGRSHRAMMSDCSFSGSFLWGPPGLHFASLPTQCIYEASSCQQSLTFIGANNLQLPVAMSRLGKWCLAKHGLLAHSLSKVIWTSGRLVKLCLKVAPRCGDCVARLHGEPQIGVCWKRGLFLHGASGQTSCALS